MSKKKKFTVSGTEANGYAVLESGGILYDLLTKEFAEAIANICNSGIDPEWDKVEAEMIRRGLFPPLKTDNADDPPPDSEN